jgi:hypothetical protein
MKVQAVLLLSIFVHVMSQVIAIKTLKQLEAHLSLPKNNLSQQKTATENPVFAFQTHAWTRTVQ